VTWVRLLEKVIDRELKSFCTSCLFLARRSKCRLQC